MKKQLTAGLTGAALVAVGFFTVSPYFFGRQAEKVLNEQTQILAKSSFLTVESHQYQRGWFSSTETLVVKLKPTLLHNAQAYLPDNLKTVFHEPITIVNHIKHGLFANGATPVYAYVDTEFQYQPETAKILKRFFGDQTPVTLNNTIRFGGSGTLAMHVAPFDYEELSGIKLNWKGLSGNTDYESGWDAYQSHYQTDGLQAKLADKGTVSLEKLDITTRTQNGRNGLSLGDSHLQLGKFSTEWKENIAYDVKLNQLVNMVTDLQIGAFINPTGSVPPSKIMVDNLSFETKMNEQDNWISSEGRFQFQKLAYGDDQYGPLDINVAAEHLDAAALLVLKNKIAEMAGKNMSDEQIQSEIIKTAKTDAAGLFTHDPLIKLNAFNFTMPQGEVKAAGELAFTQASKSDLDDLPALLKKTRAHVQLHVPEKLLETLAVNQARNVFSVNPEDAAAGKASMDDINDTIRLMVSSTVNSMQSDGYLTLTGGNIDTLIKLQNNQLTLNGKVLENPPEENFEPEAADASAASAPKQP